MTAQALAHETLVKTDRAELNGDISHLSAEQAEVLARAQVKLAHGDATAVHAVSLILDNTIRMPLYRWDDARKDVEKLARRAAKRGLPTPTIEETSRETVSDPAGDQVWVTARLLGAAPVLNGWRCVATLAKGTEPDKPIIWEARDEECPEWATSAPQQCQHCETNRRRSLTFILAHEDGRSIQVGRTCLNEYLGTDALAAWFVWSKLHEASDRFASGGGTWDYDAHAQWLADNPTAACRRAVTERPVALWSFLMAIAMEIEVNGYVKGGDAYRLGKLATGRKVWSELQTGDNVQALVDITELEKLLAWVATFDRTESSTDPYGDFAHSYTASLGRAFDRCAHAGVDRSDANMIASAMPAYRRELAQRQAAEGYASEWVPGVDSGSSVVLTLTVERDLGWALNCVDADRRCVLMQGGTYKKSPRVRAAVGETITVMGNVRDLNTYRGVKQTRINYASVYRPGEESPACKRRTRAYAARLQGQSS